MTVINVISTGVTQTMLCTNIFHILMFSLSWLNFIYLTSDNIVIEFVIFWLLFKLNTRYIILLYVKHSFVVGRTNIIFMTTLHYSKSWTKNLVFTITVFIFLCNRIILCFANITTTLLIASYNVSAIFLTWLVDVVSIDRSHRFVLVSIVGTISLTAITVM